MGEVTDVHVADLVVGVAFEGVDFGIFCSNFCSCGRFLDKLRKQEVVVICGCIPDISVSRGAI